MCGIEDEGAQSFLIKVTVLSCLSDGSLGGAALGVCEKEVMGGVRW